jgi:hypothetical protein
MARTLERMTRAARGMIGTEMAMMTLGSDGPSAADMTRARIKRGSPCMMSRIR